MSENNRICEYIYNRGSKKGQRCDRYHVNRKGVTKCHYHNDNYVEYQKKHYRDSETYLTAKRRQKEQQL